MKPTIPAAFTFALALASAPAFACDDMKAGNDGDGYQASRAPEATTVAVVDKQAPLTVTTKKQQPVKKTSGKALPQANATTRN